jgi:hypothetical protein
MSSRLLVSRDAGLAVSALDRLDAEFLDPQAGLYTASGNINGPYAALWPTSQVLNAAIAVARITGAARDTARVRRIIGSLQQFGLANSGFRVGVSLTRRYYDDNGWVAIDLLDAYDLLHDPAMLTEAEQLFSFLTTGWDPLLGGIRWATDRAEKPTVSTGPAIIVAARLAKLTGDPGYASWARRLLAWENANLRDPTGLYWDHILVDGTVDRDTVSYNQGVMLGALLALNKLTRQSTYFVAAERLAQLSEQALAGQRHSRGPYAAWDAIYYQALRTLADWPQGRVGMSQAQDFLAWAQSFAFASRTPAATDQSGLLEQAAYVITAATLGHS